MAKFYVGGIQLERPETKAERRRRRKARWRKLALRHGIYAVAVALFVLGALIARAFMARGGR